MRFEFFAVMKTMIIFMVVLFCSFIGSYILEEPLSLFTSCIKLYKSAVLLKWTPISILLLITLHNIYIQVFINTKISV
jgi:hypothetical protein